MSASRNARIVRSRPPVRQNGVETRQQLLQAAGEVFAEQGYAKATSKEICERAGANAAAVNYHFGGKDGLYASVLEEAHNRLVSLDLVASTAESSIDARDKLRMLLGRVVGEITRRSATAWELRVLSRELLSQSSLMDRMLTNQAAPKARYVRAIVAEIMQLPADHPAVSRSVVNIIGPCMFLLITNSALQRKVLPHLDLSAESLTAHLVTFALGGMEAVARETRR